MNLKIINLIKKYNNKFILNNINLNVESGKFVSLLGPSGCGKTTLLRIIAGLEFSDSGIIYFDEMQINNVNVKDRNIGFVFQNYALFNNMNVFENIAFGLKIRARKNKLLTTKYIEHKVAELLKFIELEPLAKYYPNQLSGGQKQRVALARALAISPKLLLLDEPFAALDTKVRKLLRLWLRKVHDNLKVTTILVTHDQEEALQMADEIIIMNHGKVEQIGTGEHLYNYPANPYVAEFLGDIILFEKSKIQNNKLIIGNYVTYAPQKLNKFIGQIAVYIRPNDFIISQKADNYITEIKIINIKNLGYNLHLNIFLINYKKNINIIIFHDNLVDVDIKVNGHYYLIPKKYFIFDDNNV